MIEYSFDQKGKRPTSDAERLKAQQDKFEIRQQGKEQTPQKVHVDKYKDKKGQ